MDIRKFFGKVDSKKTVAAKKKQSNGSSNSNAAHASTAAAAVAPAPEKKKKPTTLSTKLESKKPKSEERVEVSKEDFFGSKKQPSTPSNAKKRIKEEAEDLVEVSEEGSPSPKKLKQEEKVKMEEGVEMAVAETTVQSEKEEKQPESPKSSNANAAASSDDEEMPAAPASSKRKRKLVIEEDDDDDDSEDEMSTKPSSSTSSENNKKKPAIHESDDDDGDEDYKDDNDDKEEPAPTPKKVTPKRKAPAKKQKSTPPSKKKTKKEQHKESLIRPGLKLKSFNTDNAVPECLTGTTFVFTGVLENTSREASEDYVKILGGRVTTAVSGKTDYLVVGDELEDGRPYTEGSKYKKAMENDVLIVKGEEELYGLVKLYNDRASAKKPPPPAAAAAAAVAPAAAKKPVNPYAKPANPYAKTASSKPAGGPVNPYAKANPYASKSSPVKSEEPPRKEFDETSLWADRFAPQSTREILGNQENVRKLSSWLNRWEHTFNNPKAQGKTFSSPNGPWKAALISGPPGIGKTTTATLVARESGRDLLEFNASDTRSKKAISEGMGDVTGSQVLSFGAAKGGANSKPAAKKQRVIVMDEVDGMGAGDRSGMAELIKLIKGSMVPIICICNDRQSQKIKSLLPYCMDLRFRRPTKSVIARRAVQIGQQQGMRIETNAAEAIAESCGNDIRQVLNCLQMWSNKKGDSMTYKDLKERENAINKDEILRVSMFDATKILVEGRKGLAGVDAKAERESIFNRADAFFVDYGMMGLMVHQNYPKVLTGKYNEAKRAGSEAKTLEFLEQMYDSTAAMSDYAVAEHAVRSGDQNWGLLPFSAMMCVKTGYHAGGENGGFLAGFPEFTGWMGKNSTRGKKMRLLNELGHHMNYQVSGDATELRMSYLPMLRERFVTLLSAEGGPKTEEAIKLMDEYGLDREDVFENLDEFKMEKKDKTIASTLDSKQKAAFTRAYNAGSHKSQALVDEQGVGKTKKKKGSSSSGDDLKDPDVVDDDVQQESEDEGDAEDDLKEALATFAKKKKGGGRKSAAKGTKGKSKAKPKSKKK